MCISGSWYNSAENSIVLTVVRRIGDCAIRHLLLFIIVERARGERQRDGWVARTKIALRRFQNQTVCIYLIFVLIREYAIAV